MSEPAIRIESLGKMYRIAHERAVPVTFPEAVAKAFTAPFRRLRELGDHGGDTEAFWALRDVSFEVQPGEVIGIIGRNGAGKSTLLKILSRIVEPTEGQATLQGRVASLLEVGTGFHQELTGRENIYLNGSILGMKRAEIARRFDEIVAFAEVDRFLDTPVKRYSSGMYVRLAFAVAAHLEPDILIVDEVLAVGDAQFQKKCIGKLSSVATEQGRTVLFVSHNMAAVSQLCSRAVWLASGSVKAEGYASGVVEQYMRETSVGSSSRTWNYPGDAPGDDRVRLISACVFQHDKSTSVVDINQASWIEMSFEILRDVRNLIAAVNVHDVNGTCMFASADWRPNALRRGLYRKRVVLPRQLLAEGTARVLLQLVFYDPEIRSVIAPDAIAFEAIDSDDPATVRGPYKGHWPGVVRVRLNWSDFEEIAR